MNHLPERTCIACRTKSQKKTFFKIVRTKDRKVLFDEFGKIDGRSVYLCQKFKCIDRVLHTQKGDPFLHHLNVKLSPEEKEMLFKELEVKLS